MKISSSVGCVVFFIFIYVTIVSSSPPDHGEVEDEMEFSYENNGENGPENWGKLKPEWEMCGKGEMQSPIDLTDKQVLFDHNLGYLHTQYLPSNATIKNRGHDIMMKFEGGNAGLGISINGTEYKLQQLHWHSPSEHTINGKRFILEQHMVHESKDGRIAVVAFLYKLGRPDSFLFSLEGQLKRITDRHESEEHIGMIDPRNFDFESKHYYRYLGSLTTPPCSENVIWTISKEMKTVTIKQLILLRATVHDQSDTNARPLQRKNKRPVSLYTPTWHIPHI
ncbi:Alpha carbonic anhydrase 5 [Cardamine amara subsp. amara]|uniref:carbonic anhydrase n=1 Tax=Cardamine amara subsp. amara TaxID=228776 RepID=A0ABD1AFA4_CARAN